MKKLCRAASAALCAALALLLLGGCAAPVPADDDGPRIIDETPPPSGEPSPTDNTPAASAPEGEAAVSGAVVPELTSDAVLSEEDGVAYRERVVFYPDGATAANASYELIYTLPEFSAELFPAAAKYNAAMAIYEDELLGRVIDERLPFADSGEGTPYTHVECAVERSGDGLNVFLFETASYGASAEALPYVAVLGPDGTELSFAAATGIYEVSALAAQQVFNVISADPGRFYGDVAMDDIALALDLYNGFCLTEGGYRLFIRAGALAPEVEGIVAVDIPRAALYPASVGEALTIDEYEAILPALNDLVAACAIAYEGFEGSSPAPYTASVFMTRMLTDGLGGNVSTGVPAADYRALYESCFAAPMPEDIASAASDGTYIDGDNYILPTYPHQPFGLRIDDAVRTETGVILYGMIEYGVPGSADAGELTAATVRMAFTAEGGAMPFTFEAVSFE